MSDWQFNSIFPVRFWPPPSPAKYDQIVVVNWLQMEVDASAPIKMPILNELTRWRNREVYRWVRDHKEEYYVARFLT
jgi:hypothetical protein